MSDVRVTVERPDDEHIEIHVNGEVVATANYHAHGWSGLDAVERTALAVARAYASRDRRTDQPIDHRAQAAEFATYAKGCYAEGNPADAQAAAAISQAHAALAALDAQERTAAALEELVRLAATEVPDGEL